MKKNGFKRFVSAGITALMVAASIPSVPSVVANAADQQQRGNIGGYDYEMWNQNYTGNVSMQPGAGSFTCSWSGIENFLARMGKNYDSKKQNYKSIGKDITLTYDVEYKPQGNSYMCVYGWTRNPLMEYYIVEGWGDWRPPGNDGERKGTVTLDGNTYDIAKTMRYNQPSLDGTKTFPQYWSIRQTSGSRNNTTNYMKGTIHVGKHFDAWSKAGLDMSGTLYEVSLNIEGYRSSGSANVKSVRVYENGIDGDTGEDDTPKTPTIEPDANGNYFKSTFESGTGDWTARGDASIGVDSDNYYDGSSSLHVSYRGEDWHGAAITLDPNAFVPGQTYSFSTGVLQKSGKTVTMQLSLQQGSGDSATYTSVATADAKSGEWTKLENTKFTIPSGSGDLILYVETPQDSGELCDFYIDAAQGSKSGISSPVATGKGVVKGVYIPQEDPDTPQQTSSSKLSKSSTIKIMPVGDSITNGDGETGGYRKYLYSKLGQMGYSKIDMVGPNGKSSASANGITYDDNHAGYSGYQIKEVPGWGQQQGGQGSLYNKLKDLDAVKSAQPDIILLMIGTNDMTANRSMDDCASDLRDMLDYMLKDMPSDGMIFMASIPEFTAYGGNSQRIANYNSTVKKVADEYASKGKNVKFADVHGCLDGMNDIGSDNLHPNGTGYKKIGEFWAGIIDEYVSASAPAVTTTTTTAPVVTTTTTTNAPTNISTQVSLWGDANLDNTVDMSDIVLIMQSLANPSKYKLSAQAAANADVYQSGSGVTNNDAQTLQKYLLGLVKELPESYAQNTIQYTQATQPSATTTTTVPAAVNKTIISNSFDSGLQNWSARGEATVELNSDSSYSGKSLMVSGRTMEWHGALLDVSSELEVGKTYSFSAAVLQQSGNAADIQLSLQQGDGSDAVYTSIAKVNAKSGEWTKLENTSFTVPDNAGDMMLYFETVQDSADLMDICIDDVLVASEGTKSSVVTGGGTVAELPISTSNFNYNANAQFKEAPSSYFGSCQQEGKIVKETYNGINGMNNLNVYLPYGYDKSKKYNIFYLMHGGSENENTLFYNDDTQVQHMFDHMIMNGEIEPMIIVTPTFNKTEAGKFYSEFRQSVVPFVEGKYSTYAGGDTSQASLQKSRMHRAYGGFSMGSVSTWAVMENCLDIVGYFMPLSGDHWGGNSAYDKAKSIANAVDKSGLKKNEYFIFAATGSDDIAYPNVNPQVQEMKKMSQFVYTSDFSKGNFYFLVAQGKTHWWGYVRHYVYDALPYFFHEGQ